MLKNIYLYLTLFTLIGLFGCSDEFLETTPTNAISETDALANADNMMLILNGLHRQMYSQNQLPDGSSSRSGQSHFIPSLDAVGGNIIHSSSSNGWMRADLQWQMHTNANSTTNLNFWYLKYHFIASANSIINRVASEDFPIDAQISNILGQAYAYRAWAYHQLITTYSKGYLIGNPSSDPGVPLLLATESPYTSMGRGTVEQVYDQIESDIDQSIAFFQDASTPANKSHLSINAAYGIKARVALSKGDWATAAESAQNARDRFPIMNESLWLSGFNTVNLPEVIWGGTVIETETNFFQSYFYYVSPTFNGSHNRGNPKLVDKRDYDRIPDTDFRQKAFLPKAPNTNSSASNGQGGSFESDPNYDNEEDFEAAYDEIVAKYGITRAHNTHPYMAMKFLQKNPGTIDPDDVIYMRSSEMVLIEAEAKLMMGDLGGAQIALALLVDERDSNFDETSFDTQEKLLDEIKFQRRVELYGEGFSFHDHIRWDDALDQTGSGASSVLYQAGFMQDRPSVNDEWLWKLPQREIDSNPNLTEADQN